MATAQPIIPKGKGTLTGTRALPPKRGVFNTSELKFIQRPKRPGNSRYKPSYHINDGTFTYPPTRRYLPADEHPNQTIYQMTAGEVNRLDLISYRFYKTVELWWVIAQANGIGNPRRVPAGTVLKIPPIEQIFAEFLA